MEVIVEYGYESQNADELSIKKGDKIRNVTRKEDGWYEGELVHTGQRGVFPDNFVKPIKSSAKSQPPSEERHKPSSPKPSSPKPSSPKAALVPFQARVLYSYVPVNDDELSVQENQVVTVLRLVEDGWYEGMLEGKRGVFPSNYVQKLDETDELAKKKKVFGIGFGNIFSGKQIELKTKETLVQAEKRMRAKVLFDYEPIQADELRLVRNEIVFILERNLDDEGWWKGESASTGKVGVFPDNFVQLIDDKAKADALNSTGSSAASSSNNSLQREVKVDELVAESDRLSSFKKARPVDRRPPSFRAKRTEADREAPSVSPVTSVARSPPGLDDLSALRQEVETLKISAVEAHNESERVKMQLVELKKINEEQTKKMTKKMNELIFEIDEEKKTRLALQVELERLKKTILLNS